MTLTPEAALELLRTCADQVAESAEAQEFGRALFALDRVDPDLANRVVAACSAFSTEHVKIASIAFYKAGRDAGVALARQQSEHRRRPRSTPSRLQ